MSADYDQTTITTLPNGLRLAHPGPFAGSLTEFLYRECFVEDGYLRYGITLQDDACVLDVGANLGLFTLSVLSRWPGLRVHCFEPSPAADWLVQNLALNGMQAAVVRAAVSDRTGEAGLFYLPQGHALASLHPELFFPKVRFEPWFQQLPVGQKPRWIDVPRMRLGDYLAAQEIGEVDLLKVDVEGHELQVLQGLAPSDWSGIRQVVLEGHGNTEPVTRMLRNNGFTTITVAPHRGLTEHDNFQVYAFRADVWEGLGEHDAFRRGVQRKA